MLSYLRGSERRTHTIQLPNIALIDLCRPATSHHINHDHDITVIIYCSTVPSIPAVNTKLSPLYLQYRQDQPQLQRLCPSGGQRRPRRRLPFSSLSSQAFSFPGAKSPSSSAHPSTPATCAAVACRHVYVLLRRLREPSGPVATGGTAPAPGSGGTDAAQLDRIAVAGGEARVGGRAGEVVAAAVVRGTTLVGYAARRVCRRCGYQV